MGQFHNDLAALDGAFRDAGEPEGGGAEYPPDGEYPCVVTACDLVEKTIKKGRDAGRTKLLFTWKLTVTSGPEKGFRFEHRQWLSNDQQSMGYVKRDFTRIGLRLSSLTQLDDPDFRATLLDQRVKVAVKTNGQYTNTYVNGPLDPAAVSDGPAPRPHGGGASPYSQSFEEAEAASGRSTPPATAANHPRNRDDGEGDGVPF